MERNQATTGQSGSSGPLGQRAAKAAGPTLRDPTEVAARRWTTRPREDDHPPDLLRQNRGEVADKLAASVCDIRPETQENDFMNRQGERRTCLSTELAL